MKSFGVIALLLFGVVHFIGYLVLDEPIEKESLLIRSHVYIAASIALGCS